MQTQSFFTLLEQHPARTLEFQYNEDQMVRSNYHITEVKHVQIDAVDCGAGTDAWNETIVQLWENPTETNAEGSMSCYKALGILKKVHKMRPFDMSAEIKFEYGNRQFHTAQLIVHAAELSEAGVLVKLRSVHTDCKAKDACGVETEMDKASCCSPEADCC